MSDEYRVPLPQEPEVETPVVKDNKARFLGCAGLLGVAVLATCGVINEISQWVVSCGHERLLANIYGYALNASQCPEQVIKHFEFLVK